MAWFKYIKYGETLPSTTYKYPLVKREINFPKPKQNIKKDDWIYIKLDQLKIDKFVNNLTIEESDSNSYLVIYEQVAENGEQFNFVESEIMGDVLYFKAAEDHNKDTDLVKQYSLYYKTKKIKNLKQVTNNSKVEYKEVDQEESDYPNTVEVATDFLTTASISEINNYGFSFLNQNIDWLDGESKKPNSKVVGLFTGPNLTITCDVGPNFGIFKISIVRISDDATPGSEKIVDSYLVDCYSSSFDAKDVYVNTDLNYREYIFEIESNFEKNPLSSNGKIKINSFSYLYNPFLTFGLELVNPNLLSRKITGVS